MSTSVKIPEPSEEVKALFQAVKFDVSKENELLKKATKSE
jgi:hypothetical protein